MLRLMATSAALVSGSQSGSTFGPVAKTKPAVNRLGIEESFDAVTKGALLRDIGNCRALAGSLRPTKQTTN